jgi:hypothetical protein
MIILLLIILMTTNTPNPTNDQTNTQNQLNDLPWQSRVSNKVDPLNSTLPPLGDPVGTAPAMPSAVFPVTTEMPKIEQPMQVNQPIEMVQPVMPIQPVEMTAPIQINQPIDLVQPVAPVQPVVTDQPVVPVQPIEPVQPVQAVPVIVPNVEVKPVVEPVAQPVKDSGVIMTPGPAFPSAIVPVATVPAKTNELPGQSLDASAPLTGKTLPDAKNQFPMQPAEQQKPQVISDPVAANKAKVRNILVIVGVLVAGVAALVFGIFIASNAS